MYNVVVWCDAKVYNVVVWCDVRVFNVMVLSCDKLMRAFIGACGQSYCQEAGNMKTSLLPCITKSLVDTAPFQ